MALSGVFQNAQPTGTNFAQIQFFQANFQASFKHAETRQYQTTDADGAQSDSYSSAVTISLSISAIKVTSGLLGAEQVIGEGGTDDIASGDDHPRARGIENALRDLFKELEENDGLTGKVAKRLFQLVSSLNVARGTDKKLGNLDKEDREEIRSSRKQLNDFFRKKHDKVFVDQDFSNFISLVAKLETLREFVLRTTDLLSALKGGNNHNGEGPGDEQAPLINIEA